MRDFRLMTLVTFTIYAALGISNPLLSLFLQGLGASFAQISLILTAFGITSLLFNYVWGQVADRIGRRQPLPCAPMERRNTCRPQREQSSLLGQ